MQREGSFREMKRHVHYEKPSEKRARQKAEAVRRARKLARKRAQREGLIVAPKKTGRCRRLRPRWSLRKAAPPGRGLSHVWRIRQSFPRRSVAHAAASLVEQGSPPYL